MQQISQRDQRWAALQLGTSDKTIGSHGCLITSLAMIIGTTPDVVNKRLIEVGGYKDGNLVIWAKIPEAFPGMIVRREWAYNNEDVLMNLPTIVQVDGAPIGAPTHFVVYIGNQQMHDPWTGVIESTSKYTPVSYAIVQGQWRQEEDTFYHEIDGFKLNLKDMTSNIELMKYWVRGQKGEIIDRAQAANPELLQAQIDATSQCQTQLQTALSQNSELQVKLTSLEREKEEIQLKYDTSETTVLALKDEIAKIHKEDRNFGQEALDAQHLAKDRGDYIKMFAEQLDVNYNTADDKNLVEQCFKKLVELQSTAQNAASLESKQLRGIVENFIALGINSYIVARGFTPVDPDKHDPQLDEKIALFLTEWAKETNTMKNTLDVIVTVPTSTTTSTMPQTPSSVASTLITKKKPAFFSLHRLISFFLVTK